jgi:hypothetical protein
MSDNDDYSDVDWSDGEVVEDNNGNGVKNDENDEPDGTLHLNIGLTTSSKKEDDKGKGKRVSVSYTNDDHDNAINIHQTDLRSAYYRALLVSRWCNDESLAATLISLLPTDLIHISQKQRNTSAEDIEVIANWFRKKFKKMKDEDLTFDEGRDGCCANDLISNIIEKQRMGSAHQLNQLLVALLRALNFQARYVIAIDPQSHRPNQIPHLVADAKLRASKKVPGQNNKKGAWAQQVVKVIEIQTIDLSIDENRNEEGKEGDIDENVIISSKVKLEEVSKCWIEVYLTMPKTVDNFSASSSEVVNCDGKEKKGTKRSRPKDDDVKDITDNLIDPKSARKKQIKKKGSVNDCDEEDDSQDLTEKDYNKLQISPEKTSNKKSNDLLKKSKNAIVVADVCVLDESVLTEGRYVHLDLFNGGSKTGPVIDKPKLVEVSIRRKKAVSYVVAVDINGLVVDVTNRYALIYISISWVDIYASYRFIHVYVLVCASTYRYTYSLYICI